MTLEHISLVYYWPSSKPRVTPGAPTFKRVHVFCHLCPEISYFLLVLQLVLKSAKNHRAVHELQDLLQNFRL